MPATTSRLTVEWQHDDGTLERVTFDASVAEGYESSAEATEHAVERGSAISDHVRPNADTLTVEGMVTNQPLLAPGNQAEGVTGDVRALQIDAGGRTVTANVVQFSAPFDRVRTVDTRLQSLRATGQLLKIYTGLRVLDDMVIERYKVDRDASTGGALAFTLDFKKLRIASTQRVLAPRRVRRSQNRGQQPAVPVDDNSILANIADARARGFNF